MPATLQKGANPIDMVTERSPLSSESQKNQKDPSCPSQPQETIKKCDSGDRFQLGRDGTGDPPYLTSQVRQKGIPTPYLTCPSTTRLGKVPTIHCGSSEKWWAPLLFSGSFTATLRDLWGRGGRDNQDQGRERRVMGVKVLESKWGQADLQ